MASSACWNWATASVGSVSRDSPPLRPFARSSSSSSRCLPSRPRGIPGRERLSARPWARISATSLLRIRPSRRRALRTPWSGLPGSEIASLVGSGSSRRTFDVGSSARSWADSDKGPRGSSTGSLPVRGPLNGVPTPGSSTDWVDSSLPGKGAAPRSGMTTTVWVTCSPSGGGTVGRSWVESWLPSTTSSAWICLGFLGGRFLGGRPRRAAGRTGAGRPFPGGFPPFRVGRGGRRLGLGLPPLGPLRGGERRWDCGRGMGLASPLGLARPKATWPGVESSSPDSNSSLEASQPSQLAACSGVAGSGGAWLKNSTAAPSGSLSSSLDSKRSLAASQPSHACCCSGEISPEARSASSADSKKIGLESSRDIASPPPHQRRWFASLLPWDASRGKV
jgi:hypothetical protein